MADIDDLVKNCTDLRSAAYGRKGMARSHLGTPKSLAFVFMTWLGIKISEQLPPLQLGFLIQSISFHQYLNQFFVTLTMFTCRAF